MAARQDPVRDPDNACIAAAASAQPNAGDVASHAASHTASDVAVDRASDMARPAAPGAASGSGAAAGWIHGGATRLSPEQHRMLQAGRALPQQALAILDALPAVDEAFMLGAWRGSGFDTGHPLDGVLQACHWWGKRFDSAEHVHPLVFSTLTGGTVRLNPGWARPALPLIGRVPLPRSAAAGRVVQALLPLLATRRSRARLRMSVYRGVCSATMVYDQLPILDVFRKLDDDSVFVVMDLKGMAAPFFFMLRRQAPDTGGTRAIRAPWPQRGM